MRTSVGLDAPSSCAAIRAAIDNFQETRFVGPSGEWIVGAEVPLEQPWRGIARLATMLVGPLHECIDAASVASHSIPLLLCTAEPDRYGRLDGLEAPLLRIVEDALGKPLWPEPKIIAHGHVGAAVALLRAETMLHDEGHPFVIVAATDSYLLARTLTTLGEQGRLLTPDSKNGFIPGEAAAALLLTSKAQAGDMILHRPGFAVEQATILSEEPLRGDGLSSAFKDALAHAGIAMHECDYRMADVSGEQYAFKEAILALMRVLRVMKPEFDIWHPADCIGDVGAALLPCMLGVSLAAHRKRYAPGPNVIVHAGNDDGKRAALVMTPA